MQYLMPGFASGSTSCFIYLKFSGLNEIFTPETGFRRGHVRHGNGL